MGPENPGTVMGRQLPPGEFPPALQDGDELFELEDSFDLDHFQVVRREFFAHLREPAVTFNNCKFYVNTACLLKFPEVEYVQVLVNQGTKVLALRPCREEDRDSFQWCSTSRGKRRPRQTTGRLFFAKMASLMGWDTGHRYKVLGKVVYSKGEYLIAFDLTATEVYQRTSLEGETPRTSRTPVFPAEWQNQFGMPLEEHKQSLQINIFEGYAVFAIKDTGAASSEALSPDGGPHALPGVLPDQEGSKNG